MKTAEDRAPNGDTWINWVFVGYQEHTDHHAKALRKAREEYEALKSTREATVRECCRLFREKCPACDNGHVCNGGESSYECQVCGEGLQHVYAETGVKG